jgi:hypothetical protein
MKGYEHLVTVLDKNGGVFVCGMDCDVGSELTCTWDNERVAPRRFEDLLEHERNSCRMVDGANLPRMRL